MEDRRKKKEPSSEPKVSKTTTEWKRNKKWETKHKGFQKYLNSNKAKIAEKEFKPWETVSIEIDDVDY